MKTAFVFSGQGSQYPGMFRELYEHNPDAKKIFDLSSEVLGRDIAALCFDGTYEELNLTHNTQPCVLTSGLASAFSLIASGITPDAVAGFSLGEYAAMALSGVIPMKDVFPLIQLRADAMQKAVPAGEGGMAAIIGKKAEEVEEMCTKIIDDYVVPSNYNSTLQTVVSGTSSGVDKLVKLAESYGVMAVRLKVSAPFHCSLMKSAADELLPALRKITISSPNIPVYLNYTGKRMTENADAVEMLYNQAFNPVRWTDTIKNMVEDGVTHFVECGPGKTLSGLIKSTVKGITVLRAENISTLENTIKTLKAE